MILLRYVASVLLAFGVRWRRRVRWRFAGRAWRVAAAIDTFGGVLYRVIGAGRCWRRRK